METLVNISTSAGIVVNLIKFPESGNWAPGPPFTIQLQEITSCNNAVLALKHLGIFTQRANMGQR